MAAFAFKVQHGIHHVLHHLGPGNRAFLGDVSDEDQRCTPTLGKANQLLRRAAHLRHGAGCGLQSVQIHGLDRVNDQ